VAKTTETKITSIEDAVESIIAPSEEPTEEVTEEIQATEETIEEVEATAESETEEVEEEESEEEVEEIEASDQDDEDLIDETSQEEPELIPVKVNGQERMVTLKDLQQGYAGQEYVQQGMQDVAKMRKEAESVYHALNDELKTVSDFKQQLQNGGLVQTPVKPDKELFENDPLGYMKKDISYQEEKTAYENQMAQFEQVSQQNSEAQQNAKQAFLQEQVQILQRDIPEFADAKQASKLKDQLVNFGTKHYGYTIEEISNITESKAIKVLYDAMRYQGILAGKSQAKVKTKSAKPVLKPGAKRVSTSDAKIRSRQQAQLRKTGSIDDAVGLIMQS